MGVTVTAIYRPRPGQEAALDAEVAGHVPELRRLGLATDVPATVLRASDGSVVEIFEWTSHDAIAAAHESPEVLAMWDRFGAACTYGTLAGLPDAATMFTEFTYVATY